MEKYGHYLPEKPRIIDPSNPYKNLYKHGVCQIEPQKKDSFPMRWQLFLREIHNLDLTVDHSSLCILFALYKNLNHSFKGIIL